MWADGVRGCKFRQGGLSDVFFVFQFGFGSHVKGSYSIEALWSGRTSLCTKGAFVALPGECSILLKVMPLRRYFMVFSLVLVLDTVIPTLFA